jgi:hypothetical protein
VIECLLDRAASIRRVVTTVRVPLRLVSVIHILGALAEWLRALQEKPLIGGFARWLIRQRRALGTARVVSMTGLGLFFLWFVRVRKLPNRPGLPWTFRGRQGATGSALTLHVSHEVCP